MALHYVLSPPEPKPKAKSPAACVADAIADGKRHLLLAASGSVATIKLPLIISALEDHQDLSIRVVLTQCATPFLAGQSKEQPTLASLSHMPNVDGVYLDGHEWAEPWTREAPILHIELRRWAHLLVIAPMSANLLAKVAGGFCDDLLSCVVRAWDTNKQIAAAPAMNEMMWENPVTASHLSTLEQQQGRWFEILPPQSKALACGDVGQGGMCDWNKIVEYIEGRLADEAACERPR